jgi:murein DD-endopeptidase MepM/ murein hydrolase activator NlpD
MRRAAWTLAGMLALGALPVAVQARTASPRVALLPAWVGDYPRFGWSGAWLFPVGSPYEIGRPGEGSPAYRINRCIGGPEEGGGKHQGADLSCGHGGDLVRAAGYGLVVKAETHGWNGGYGRHIVIAHRLVGGGLVYSVYAHLQDQSLRVKKGQIVAAGQPLARVGRSGRASSEHLHFEVRLAAGQDEAWQHAEVLDPITFVTEHLPAIEPRPSPNTPYLEWAECSALLASADRADSTLGRATWWQMMARAAKPARDDFPADSDGVRRMLIGEGVLDADGSVAPPDSLTWAELARDLRRLKKVGVMIARPPITPAAHRALCGSQFAAPRPTMALDQLAKRKGVPQLGEACVTLADLSSTWEVAKKKPKPPAVQGPALPPAAAPPAVRGIQASSEVDSHPR